MRAEPAALETWEEFRRLPRFRSVSDIHCVTRWSKFDTLWEGVSVKAMVDNGVIKIKSRATHVMQHAEYGFTVNLPLARLQTSTPS